MKYQIQKILGLLVVCAMMAGFLAGCGGTPSHDPIEEVMGHSKDTLYFTLDGDKVTAGDYLFWLAQYVDRINSAYMYMGYPGLDWEEDLGEGMTASEYFRTQTVETVKTSWAIEQLAKDEGVSYTAQDREADLADIEQAIELMGGEENYDLYLKSMLMTRTGMEEATRVSTLYNKMVEVFQENGGRFEVTPEEIRTYMEDQGILYAKHILLLTADPNIDGSAFSDEEIAAARALAEDLLGQLRSSEDPIALFDELMFAYSEDTGLGGNPDGYLFSTQPDGVNFTSRMVEEFENGTLDLSYNEIGDIVESDYGFHIILRLDPTENEDIYDEYCKYWQETQMDLLLQERIDAVAVVTTETFENLDVYEFYEKLTAYREALVADAEAADAARPSEEEEGVPADDGAPDEGDPAEG